MTLNLLCYPNIFILTFSSCYLGIPFASISIPAPKIRLTSAALGYDLAHCTASAFSPLIATILVQNHGVNSPGLLYPFFASLAIVGMFMSTKIHRDGGIGDAQVQMAKVLPELNPVV